jgi:hypothetical protein
MHINLEAIKGENLHEFIQGKEDVTTKQRYPGLAELLHAHYGMPVYVTPEGTHKRRDEVNANITSLSYTSLNDHSKRMLGALSQSDTYDNWLPRYRRDAIVISYNLLFGNAVTLRNTFKPINAPGAQGAFQKFHPMVASYAFYRYATNYCFPDLVLSYEPPIELVAAKFNEAIEKTHLEANAYAYMKAAYLEELADMKAANKPVKSDVIPLAPVGVTKLPTMPEVVKAMFDVVVQTYPNKR